MKNSYLTLVFIIISTISFQPVHGQRLLKNIKDRIQEETEKKIEEKAVEKANKEIDKAIDAAFENEENDSSKNTKSNNEMLNIDFLSKMNISSEPIPVEDSYSFQQKIEMHITTYNKSGETESEGDFITLLSSGSKNMAYKMISGDMSQPGEGNIIIDGSNNAMIILSEDDGEKRGMIYGFGSFLESIGESYEEADAELSENPESYLANPNVKKTGKSKKIAGYKCEEYIFEDDKTESEIWITKDLKMDGQDYFSTIYKTSLYSSGIAWGYMMEATSTDKESGNKTKMEVTDVDRNSKITFKLSDYEVTNLGNLSFPVGDDN